MICRNGCAIKFLVISIGRKSALISINMRIGIGLRRRFMRWGMIDYDKLKIAFSLCDRMNNVCDDALLAISYPSMHMDLNVFSLGKCFSFDNLDDLIEKLTELTKPEPQYKVAWYVSNGGFAQCTNVHN